MALPKLRHSEFAALKFKFSTSFAKADATATTIGKNFGKAELMSMLAYEFRLDDGDNCSNGSENTNGSGLTTDGTGARGSTVSIGGTVDDDDVEKDENEDQGEQEKDDKRVRPSQSQSSQSQSSSKRETSAEREANFLDLMNTQQSQKATQVARLERDSQRQQEREARACEKREQREVRDRDRQEHRETRVRGLGRLPVCVNMMGGKECDGTSCSSDDKGYLHPPVCKARACEVPRDDRPRACKLWHLGRYPNARRESKSQNGGKNGRRSHGSGNSRNNSGKSMNGYTAKQSNDNLVNKLKQELAAAKQDAELAKLRASVKQLKTQSHVRTQSHVTYAAAAAPPQVREAKPVPAVASQSLEQRVAAMVAEQVAFHLQNLGR
jgi:hypothetical protein